MVQKVNFNNLTGDTLTVGNTVITGTGVTVGGDSLGQGVTVYANASVLPTSGLTSGTLAYTGNAIFITNGSGWYRVAVTNQDPSITLSASSASLVGNNSVVDFTYTASDADGTTPTITVTNSGFSSTSTATIQHFTGNNTIRLTNLANTTYNGTITVTASDGISTGFGTFTASVTASIAYVNTSWSNTVLSIGTSSTNSLDNSTFIDRSINARGSAVNTWGTSFSQTAFHPYLDNWSVYFDGSNDTTTQLVYSLDSEINMGSDDYTVEVWCKATVSEDRDGVFNFKDADSGAYYFMFRHAVAADTWEIYFYGGASYTVTHASSSSPVGNWVHHAFVRQSGTFKWYIDGVEKLELTSGNFSAGLTWDVVDTVDVGKYSAGRWPGWISNLRVVKGDALYTANNFTVPSESLEATSNTILLLASSNTYENKGSLSSSYTVGGTILPSVSAHNPFGQESEYNVGANTGSVNFTTTDGIDLKVRSSGTASTWTIEFWYKFDPTSTLNANHYLFDARGTAGSQTAGSLYVYRSSDTTYNDGSNWGITDANFNDGAWHWFTMVSDGTNRAIWIDGTRIAELSGTRTVGTHLWINSRETNQYHNDCDISDFRFSSNARYATSSTTISVPTSPVGTDGNTTAYYPFDNAGIFDKTGNHTLTLVGDTSTSTTQTKFAFTSMYFDGSGDYITVSEGGVFGTNSWTIEAWVYRTGTTTRAIFGHNTALSNSDGFTLVVNSSSELGAYWGSAYQATVASFTSNQWVHVAATYDGTNLRLFTDGTLGATSAESIDFTVDDFFIGNNVSNQYWKGYIENFQILKNYAKYTANFTPPTATQGIGYQAES